ncbi:MAG: DUF5696 domain-containing protein [Firmicutes bacterium]|nr:DUF5696 domain-containing protein [Bacillota bacterium]
MKHHHKYLCLSLALLFLAGCGRGAGVNIRAGQAPKADAPGRGPHATASVMERTDPLARSGWLELFFDEASRGVSIRSHSEAEWSVLARAGSTPKSNAGACAVEADIYVNGHKITLNSQDHSVAYGSAAAAWKAIRGEDKKAAGVEVAYTLTPDAPTAARAAKKALKADDVAFLVRVRYLLLEGNFHVEADWENLNGNPGAFIATLGLMERFGALRSPGPEDFFLLPDGCGAMLYPARSPAGHTEDLRFAVYGSDLSIPGGDALHANVAAWGVRGQGAGFVAVAEQGAALCEIVARQSVSGEVPLSAVGPRFTVTPVALDAEGRAIVRAPVSYGAAKGEMFSITYRFFYGDSARFGTMATACREQLISTGILSSTKTVGGDGTLPLELTLLGTGPAKRFGQRKLTTFDQALDILTRLKNKGVNSMNVRYQSALRGGWLQSAPERLAPLLRLGGARGLEPLQDYCKAKGLTLFLDARAYSGNAWFVPKAENILGQPIRGTPRGFPWQAGRHTLPLRAASSFTRASRAILIRLGKLNTGGIALGGPGNTLYADYAGAGTARTEIAQRVDQLLPALSARWSVMLENGDFYAVRHADVIANLPLEPQVQMPGGRYVAVPLLPILLHSSADYSGAPLNLAENDAAAALALLRSISFGACPAFTLQAAETGEGDGSLAFERQLEKARDAYTRANAALAGLRGARITEYTVDAATGVIITGYSNEAKVYVNLSREAKKTKDEITVPPMDFVRIG